MAKTYHIAASDDAEITIKDLRQKLNTNDIHIFELALALLKQAVEIMDETHIIELSSGDRSRSIKITD